MANTTINLRDVNASGKTALYCILFYSGKSVKISTEISIEPKYWSNTKKQIKPSYYGDATALNNRLRKLQDACISEYNKFTDSNGREPSPAEIKKIVQVEFFGGVKKDNRIPKDFYSYWKHFVLNQKNVINSKTGNKISETTIKGYENALLKISDFEIEQKYSISFDSIDLEFYNLFVEYLESKGYSKNYIGKNISLIKSVMNDATSNGVNSNLKFKSKKFTTPSEETTSVYLNESELKEIESLDLSDSERLDRARDLFLLLCYTGQRFQSLPDIVNPKNRNNDFIRIKQQKTGTEITIPILPPVKYIFDKHPNLYVLSNHRLNLYIKDVCKMIPSLEKMVDVEYTVSGKKVTKKQPKYKLIGTHTGRRSFATNFYNKKTFPIGLIMAITGHKKESTFFKYIRATPDDNAVRFRELYLSSNLKVV
jgi:integrase